jgi:hypothetical protein
MMIYQTISPDDPIRQGDIFRHVPRVDLSLGTIALLEDDVSREMSWRDIEEKASVTAVLPIRSVFAVVMTQDCDAARGEYLSLCQVDPFLAARKMTTPPKNPKRWQSLIVEHARANHRLFYLPADPRIGFTEPMIADFLVILRLPRADLESIKDQRVARLNDVACDHLRESFAHFFRRYAYNEWYPLTKEEFQAYAEERPEPVKSYPWQE